MLSERAKVAKKTSFWEIVVHYYKNLRPSSWSGRAMLLSMVICLDDRFSGSHSSGTFLKGVTAEPQNTLQKIRKIHAKAGVSFGVCSGAQGVFHRVLKGAAQRGAQFTSFLRLSRPFFVQQSEPFYLETCTPPEGNPPKHRSSFAFCRGGAGHRNLTVIVSEKSARP